MINTNLSKHAPIKEKRIKRSYQSGWFEKELKCAIWQKNLLKKNTLLNTRFSEIKEVPS